MPLKIRKSHELGGICFLWVYDVVKFWVFGDLLRTQGINPVIFLFFDMVTVPPFIMGSARLVNALSGDTLPWPRVLGWGLILLFSTFLPYVYAALAGKSCFNTTAWIIFWSLIVLILANLVRTVWVRVCERRTNTSKPPRCGKQNLTP